MNVAEPKRKRISDEEYLRRYEQEVSMQIAACRRSSAWPGGGALRSGQLAYCKGDGARLGYWHNHVCRLMELRLWRGALWAMNSDGSWRRWSHYRLLDDGPL